MYLTLSQTTILDSSKLKEFADNNLIFDKTAGKFSKKGTKRYEKKGEIVRYEQFISFWQFSRHLMQTRRNTGLFGNGLKMWQSPWRSKHDETARSEQYELDLH